MSTRFLAVRRSSAARTSLCAAAFCLVCAIPASAQDAASTASSPARLYAGELQPFSPEIVLVSDPLDPSARLLRDATLTSSVTANVASTREALDTLATTARANDFDAFTSALAAAHRLAEDMPGGESRALLHRTLSIYDDLQRVWEFSRNDTAGSFYDEDALPGFYPKLARDYSGYADAMEPLRITDNRGTQLFPTAETRSFLLQRAAAAQPPSQLAGRRIVTGRRGAASSRNAAPDDQTIRITADLTPSDVASPVATAGRHHRPTSGDGRADSTVTRVVSPSRTTAKPRIARVGDQRVPPAQAPAPPSAATSTPAGTPAQTEGRSATAVAAAIPVASPQAADITVHSNSSEPAPTQRGRVKESAETSVDTTGRAILFIIVGLIAIAALSLVLRTPKGNPLIAPLPTQSTNLPATPEPEPKPEPTPDPATASGEETTPRTRRRAR